MNMTGTEPPISISDGNLIMIGVVIVTVFVIVLILVMINDYRLYLGNHWKRNSVSLISSSKNNSISIYCCSSFFW